MHTGTWRYRRLHTSGAAILVMALAATLIMAPVDPTGVQPAFADADGETVWLDTRSSASTTEILQAGVHYSVTVDGTWSAWSASSWDNPCGQPEDAPMYPSDGVTNGKVGMDAEVMFASVHSTCEPGHRSWFEIDTGSGFVHVEAEGGPWEAPAEGHAYRYRVEGEGQPATFQVVDSPTSDNYGQLKIVVSRIDESGLPDERTFGDGQGPHAIDPSGRQSDPVNSATGAFTTSATDLVLPGVGHPFELSRSYTSADATDGPLGVGWQHSFNVTVTEQADGAVRLRAENGQQVAYEPDGAGGYLLPVGGRSTLAAGPGGGWLLTRRDGAVYSFDAAGRLTGACQVFCVEAVLSVRSGGGGSSRGRRW